MLRVRFERSNADCNILSLSAATLRPIVIPSPCIPGFDPEYITVARFGFWSETFIDHASIHQTINPGPPAVAQNKSSPSCESPEFVTPTLQSDILAKYREN